MAATTTDTTPARFTRPTDVPAADGFARLLDLRDGPTSRHSDRVVRLALAIAARLGLSSEAQPVLRDAARLHDVGKIGVPDRILLKDKPLDPDEWAVMRCHPTWGAEVLEAVPELEAAAVVVRGHHERWDGRGYPAGIAGEDIPLESRIIGAADAYCAMTDDRPYRSALTVRRARELMRAAAGANFDAEVVDALLKVLDDHPQLRREPARDRERQTAWPAEAAVVQEPTGMREALEAVTVRAHEHVRRHVLELLDQAHPPTGRIVEAIETDPGLTAAVLSMARAGGVAAAVDALGAERIAAKVARAPTFDVLDHLRASVLAPERFRLHAVATLRALRHVARMLDETDLDELEAGALLHDVGKLVLARMHPGYPADLMRADSTPEERLHAERRELGLDHAIAGATLLRAWGLPPAVTALVAHHHDDGHGRGPELLRLADMLAHYVAGEAVDAAGLLAVAERRGLPGDALRSVMFQLHARGGDLPRRTDPSPLSPRERDALRGLAEGKVYKEIGADLGLSTSTVRSHLSSAYAKLDVGDRAQAVLLATERGWI